MPTIEQWLAKAGEYVMRGEVALMMGAPELAHWYGRRALICLAGAMRQGNA